MSAFPVTDVVSGWRLAPAPPPPAAWWPQELLRLEVVDEITGAPPEVTVAASTTVLGLGARATDDLAGLAGQPLLRYRPSYVAGAPLEITLSAPGYLPLSPKVMVSGKRVNPSLGSEPGYPGVFTPVDLGKIALHREPVTISGRTVSKNGSVLVGATLSLGGVWLTLADLTKFPLAPNPAAPNLVSLASPLYADRDATATISAQPMTAATQTKTLLQPANVGDASVLLSDQVGLAVGGIVAFDSQDPGRAEFLAVTAITAQGAGPMFPAIVALAFPLSRPHASGATVIQMVPSAVGAANTLSAAAGVGDVTVLISAMTGLSAVNIPVVIAGGGVTAAEYHFASPIEGKSDPRGDVTLPPVHRATQLRLLAHHGTVDLQRDVMLPLGVTDLTIDFVFP
jgi:hypothetical protein